MSLDPSIILSSIVGGLIAISGSLAVAALYIRNQNKIENKRRLHERIQEAYFEEGLLPIEAALSEYGTSTVFAIADLRIWVARCLKFKRGGPKLLEAKIEEILKRPAITDLTEHNFSLAMKCFPTLQRFGMSLYNSIKRTFQLYSRVLSDQLTLEHIQRQIANSSIDEFIRASAVVAEMIQHTQIYIERRLENLKDYVWQRDYEKYLDFLEMTKEQSYQAFLSELNQYLEHLNKWSDALTSKKSEDRKETSLALSKWLIEHIDINPFQQELRTSKT